MNNIPADLEYTEHDEWIRVEIDGMLIIGITGFAQEQLGDTVFLGLPETDRAVAKDKAIAVVESVKTVSDIFVPVAGEIVINNANATSMPKSMNVGTYKAWLFKIKPINADDVDILMSTADYEVEVG